MLSYLTNWLFRKTFLSAVCRYSLTDNLTDKVYWINLLVIPSLVCDVRRNVCWQGCLVSTWTSCMSSCLSSSIILTWKDVMVVQQPIFKYSNTSYIEILSDSHRDVTMKTDLWELTSHICLYLLTVSWALTAWWTLHRHQPPPGTHRWDRNTVGFHS